MRRKEQDVISKLHTFTYPSETSSRPLFSFGTFSLKMCMYVVLFSPKEIFFSMADDKIIHIYVVICTYTYIMSNRQIHRSCVVHCIPYLVYSVDPLDVSKSETW